MVIYLSNTHSGQFSAFCQSTKNLSTLINHLWCLMISFWPVISCAELYGKPCWNQDTEYLPEVPLSKIQNIYQKCHYQRYRISTRCAIIKEFSDFSRKLKEVGSTCKHESMLGIFKKTVPQQIVQHVFFHNTIPWFYRELMLMKPL